MEVLFVSDASNVNVVGAAWALPIVEIVATVIAAKAFFMDLKNTQIKYIFIVFFGGVDGFGRWPSMDRDSQLSCGMPDPIHAIHGHAAPHPGNLRQPTLHSAVIAQDASPRSSGCRRG
jgi:hypothetical protein